MNDAVFSAFGRAVEALGTPDFPMALSNSIGTVIPWETRGIVRYSAHSVPYYLMTENISEDEVNLYLSGFYRVDPFLRHWRETSSCGVFTLTSLARELSPGQEHISKYLSGFQVLTGMDDEIGFLCPRLGGALDDYFFLLSRPYTQKEVRAATEAFPLVNSLSQAHERVTLQKALSDSLSGDNQEETPEAILITDDGGQAIYTSSSWSEMAKSEDSLTEAVQFLSQHPDVQSAEYKSGVVHRNNLDASSSLAQGGTFFRADNRLAAKSSIDLNEAVDSVFMSELTPRELEIVKWVVKGYPSVSIAQKIGLAVSTVRQHRKRIFAKLDITTERELFLMVIQELLN